MTIEKIYLRGTLICASSLSLAIFDKKKEFEKVPFFFVNRKFA